MSKSLRINLFLNFTLILFFLCSAVFADEIQIIKVDGDVKFRRGVEENWYIAEKDILLEDIDSIWTGEDGTVILRLQNNRQFMLEENSMLDMADLRTIAKEDLFLILMRQKIKKIDNSGGKIPLEIGTVSVVHGSSKDSSQTGIETDTLYQQGAIENGIRALFQQEFYANTIVKVQQFFNYFSLFRDCGELDYYVGRSFEMLNQFGQAMDAYEISVTKSNNETCPDPHWGNLSANRLEQLKKQDLSKKEKE
jgi:hypothetical protein